MNRVKKAEPARFPEFQAAFVELMGDMTIKEFADKLGMSRATVGFYSAGQRIPDAMGIKIIAEKCGVSADWLLGLSNFPTIAQKKEANDLFDSLTELMEIEFDEHDRRRVRRTLTLVIEGFRSAMTHYGAYTWYENAMGHTALALSSVAQCLEFAQNQDGISHGEEYDPVGTELFGEINRIIDGATTSAYVDLGHFFNACRREIMDILNAGDCYEMNLKYATMLSDLKKKPQK